MIKLISFRALVPLLALAAAACVADAPPPLQITERSGMSKRSQAVADALSGVLLGAAQPADPAVRFAEGADTGLTPDGYHYPGFKVTGLGLYFDEALGAKAGKKGDSLTSGLVTLENADGRRAKVIFRALHGEAQGGNLVIREAATGPAPVDDPEVKVFLVPADKVEKDIAAAVADSFGAFRALMAGAAVTPEAARRAHASDATPFYVAAFPRDRTSPSAKLTLKVSDNANADLPFGYTGASRLLDYDGWKVAVLSGTFRADTDTPLYVKAVFEPGDEAGATASPKVAAIQRLSGPRVER